MNDSIIFPVLKWKETVSTSQLSMRQFILSPNLICSDECVSFVCLNVRIKFPLVRLNFTVHFIPK